MDFPAHELAAGPQLTQAHYEQPMTGSSMQDERASTKKCHASVHGCL
jgi:hypothetical protein